MRWQCPGICLELKKALKNIAGSESPRCPAAAARPGLYGLLAAHASLSRRRRRRRRRAAWLPYLAVKAKEYIF